MSHECTSFVARSSDAAALHWCSGVRIEWSTMGRIQQCVGDVLLIANRFEDFSRAKKRVEQLFVEYKVSHRGHLAVAQRVRDQLNRARNELPIDAQPCLDQVLEWLGTSAHRVAPGPVATVVDTARRYAGKFDQAPTAAADTAGPRQPPHHFASQENYFPVFETNTRDLQTLEARVVINITEFYTYMKAFRDSAVLFEMIYSRTEVNRAFPGAARLRAVAGTRRRPRPLRPSEPICPDPRANGSLSRERHSDLIRSASARLACCDAKLHCFVSCGARPTRPSVPAASPRYRRA
jgi:hypothetical protein